MKKLLVFLFALSLAACQKDEQTAPKLQPPSQPSTGNVIFYSTDMQWRWGLMVDHQDYGSIAQAPSAPECGNAYFQNLELTEGAHLVEYPSLSGIASLPSDTIYVTAGSCKQINVY